MDINRRRLRLLLLQQLQLLLAILHGVSVFVSTEVYVPQGVRTYFRNDDSARGEGGEGRTRELIEGHPARIYDLTRVPIDVFLELVKWLELNGLKATREMSVARQLLIFLTICAQAETYQKAGEDFQCSIRTVQIAFHRVLNALLLLHREIVRLPPNETPEAIKENPKLYPFFSHCVGALDGTHILAWVPESHINKSAYRNRKKDLSQNVLAVVDFEMNFVYVLPGWEGAANDSRVLNDAIARGFRAAPGWYYLADGGYSCKQSLVLTPYQKTRYHLQEQARAALKPANPKELYNLRHAQLRNVVERTFGVLKRRFRIFMAPPIRHSLETQAKLVMALTAVHNFLNLHGLDPEKEALGVEAQDERLNARDWGELDSRSMIDRRDRIAEVMWERYQSYQRFS